MSVDYYWMLAAAVLLALDLRYSGKGLCILAFAAAVVALLLYSGTHLGIFSQLLVLTTVTASLFVLRHWVHRRRRQHARTKALGEGIILSVTSNGRATLLFEEQELPCVALSGVLRVGDTVVVHGFGNDLVYCVALDH